MQRIVVGFFLAAALVAGACGKPEGGATSHQTASGEKGAAPANKSGRVIAKFAGESFTEGEFRDEMSKLSRRARGALSDAERRRQFVDNYVLSRLIYKKGVEKRFDTDAEVLKQLEDLKRRLVIQRVMQEQQTAPVDDAEVQGYYDAHSAEFATDRVKASHILVIDEAVAKDLLAKLRKDPSQFENLAKEHSIDKANAEKGGDLGLFGRGRMVKEFEEAAFGLGSDGELSEVVHTRFGYHIIKRTGREEGKIKPFDEVKNQIRIRLINDKRRQRTEEFLTALKTEAGYEVDMDVLAAVPLDDLPEPEQAQDLPAGH
ncbi:MAG TPA: peptidylprolyl isomerase [Candidatus Binatia bacterium]|nr:peptidylprolyl isomerase [Candidatus Binatia bacterium]